MSDSETDEVGQFKKTEVAAMRSLLFFYFEDNEKPVQIRKVMGEIDFSPVDHLTILEQKDLLSLVINELVVEGILFPHKNATFAMWPARERRVSKRKTKKGHKKRFFHASQSPARSKVRNRRKVPKGSVRGKTAQA